ncbi:MAG: hypothetical protein AABX07_04525 [Nanoarchaeota archaeon]
MDNCITCSSLCCSSPDRSVQNLLQATQFSVFMTLSPIKLAWQKKS